MPSQASSQVLERPKSVSHLVLAKLQKMGLARVTEEQVDPSKPATERVLPTLEEQKRIILATSLENQRHYIMQAQKTGRPWFQNPKHTFQYSEFVYITSEMAQMLLQYNDNTRTETKSQSDGYSRDMSTENWIPTAESIAIDLAGNMFDGQHRASAIVSAGIAVPIYVTWNVVIEARFVQDSGKKRNVNDKLNIIFENRLPKKTPALCRAMMAGFAGRAKYTEMEIAEFALKHQEALQWVLEHLPKQRADVQAAVAKAYIWYGEPKIIKFVNNLANITFSDKELPEAALYRVLEKAGTDSRPDSIYRKAVQAIECHVTGEKIERLYVADADIFEWDTGWTVPNRA